MKHNIGIVTGIVIPFGKTKEEKQWRSGDADNNPNLFLNMASDLQLILMKMKS